MEAIYGEGQRKVGKLTDDDIDVIRGKREQLVGRVQERYGIAKDVAEKQADEFVKGLQEGNREEAREEGRERGKAHQAGR